MNTSTIVDNESKAIAVSAAELDGVRTARIFAFLIDYAIVLLLSLPAAIVILLLGIITFGIALGLYAVLVPLVAVIYVGKTMGGPAQATVGMQMMGIKVKKLDGGHVDPLLAIVHALLFWTIHSVTLILPLLVSFFSSKKRLIHDILLGTYVARVL